MSNIDEIRTLLKSAAIPLLAREIAEGTAINKGTVASSLNAMVAAGEVEALEGETSTTPRRYVWAMKSGVQTAAMPCCGGTAAELDACASLSDEPAPKPVAPTPAHAEPTPTTSQQEIAEVCDGIKAMLLQKNAAYGDSALSPMRIFSKASAEEQILVRIDDKLSRIMRGAAAGEDVITDLIGYFILLKVQRDGN